MRHSTQTRKVRGAIMCVVIGAHALAILLLLSIRREAPAHSQERYVVWIPLVEPRALPRANPVIPEIRSEPPERIELAAPVIPVSPSVSTGVEPRERPSWQDQGAFYARKAVEDATTQRQRNLGPRKPASPAEPAVPELFESKKPVFGETAEDAMDTPIVRLGENCYVELSKKVPTAGDFAGGAAANTSMRTGFKCAFKIGSEVRVMIFSIISNANPPSSKPPRSKQQKRRQKCKRRVGSPLSAQR